MIGTIGILNRSKLTNKFECGDTAVYTELGTSYVVTIDAYFSLGDTWHYHCSIPSPSYRGAVVVRENELMTPTEFQGRVDRGAIDFQHSPAMPKKLKCVCGAHKVKDSRHSSWCDIKN